MSGIHVTVQIRATLPVPVRDLPTLQRVAEQSAAAHGVDPATLAMAQDGEDLVLGYVVVAS